MRQHTASDHLTNNNHDVVEVQPHINALSMYDLFTGTKFTPKEERSSLLRSLHANSREEHLVFCNVGMKVKQHSKFSTRQTLT